MRGPGAGFLAGATDREQLLKLVEHENQANRHTVARPLAQAAPVEMLPEGIVGARAGGLGLAAGVEDGAGDGGLDLLGQGRRGSRVIEANGDRQVPLGPQPREQSRLQEGGLAQARLAKEHRQILALHPPQ